MGAAEQSDPGAPANPPIPASTRWSDTAAVLALAVLGGSWTWWSLEFGAYFGNVLYPGVALLCLATLILLTSAPWRASFALSGAARLTVWSLVLLAGWSLASALWSPTPDIAVEDAQRVLGYALAFGLGVWSCALLGRRMELAMLPLVGAAGIVALVTMVGMAKGNGPLPYLELDGTLQYPLGYRNANAAFFLIALWPALCLAGSPRVHTAVRVGALGAATACAELALLSQSRASVIAFAAALIVYLITVRDKARGVLWLLIAALPALALLPAATDMFEAAKNVEDTAGLVDAMNSAGSLALIVLAASLVLGFVAIRIAGASERVSRFGATARIATAVVAVVLAVGAVAFGSSKVEEFCGGEADLSQSGSRFTLDAGSNRCKVWDSALSAAGDDPVFGLGGGGFQFFYTENRDDENQLARDAHSVWLENLSELGIIGLILVAAAIGGAFAGPLRARKLGPAAAGLSCAALAGGSYWIVHASVDWFWPYPAVSAPVLALLGAASAPNLLAPDRREQPRGRKYLMLAVGVLALSVVPPFLSERLVDRSLQTFRASTADAYSDLDLARKLNPLTDTPALTEGAIARALNDRDRSIAAFREAARKRPDDYTPHYFLALLYATDRPDLARTELAVVKELNPLTPRIKQIEARIDAAEQRLAGPASRVDQPSD